MKIETKVEIIIEAHKNNRSKLIRESQALLDEMTAELAKELRALLDEIIPQNIDSNLVFQTMMERMLNNCISSNPANL